ncbi:MAG TPA: cation-translocating P-type ATPase [candidate division Zixibacteria bacterium]|nr:cation-translocating P-type ATPase [candidate division Zixibacteria bacterium]
MTKKSIVLKIDGVDCSGCARNIEQKLLSSEGIVDARINLVYKRIFVDYDYENISENEIKNKIINSGYSIEELEKETDEIQKPKKSFKTSFFNKKEFYTTLLSGLMLGLGIILELIVKSEISSLIILILGTLVGGIFIFRKALFSIKDLNLDINVLMSIAAIAALIIGEAIEANSIVFLFSIAELAETFSVERAKGSIEQLINFAPTDAVLLIDEEELIVPAKEVEVNSIIVVKPGERIPLDGVIIKGESYINQSPITGESVSVVKSINDEVFAGTFNEDGILKIKVTKPYDEMFLRKIVSLVESSDQRAPIESFVNTFAKYYTPIMFLIASLTLLIPPLITGDPFIEWVYISLIILVISCPCAVVLSTPITIIATLTRSARNGVLIKGGTYIEELSKTKVFVFDKTGTLTIGHPEIDSIHTNDEISEKELLTLSGSLEKNSTHPIARAIIERMNSEKISPLEVLEFKTVAGKGVQGKINGQIWLLGNPRLIIEKNLEISDKLASLLSVLQSERKTVVIISSEQKIFGLISVSDQMKPHAKGMVTELKALKANKIIMLTGDNSKTAAKVAQELGIDEYIAELLPDQKMEVIQKLNNKYTHVAMIGDGINDAPSLALANVGITMGTSGSDIALEAADVALMTDRLDDLHYLITASKKAMRIIKQNITIAILIKIILFVLSYFGLVSLWMAVLIGDMGVSLFVIFNAIFRAKGQKMSHTYCDQELCFEDFQHNKNMKKTDEKHRNRAFLSHKN